MKGKRSKEEEFDEITGRKGRKTKRINKTVDKTVDNEDRMYHDISRLVKILERIAKRVEREMKNNKYGN
jgi:hypothetical protein